MTADERLDQLLLGAARGGRPDVGINPMGSPPQNPVSPSRAIQMMSPPREPTRTTVMSPYDVPITDVTSDENGRDVVERVLNPSGGNLQLGDEVVEMTQRHLTSEFELAVFSNRVTENEIRERNLEYELSQETYLFNQARQLILEMREAFSVEDDGCTRRIEMLETQRNACAAGIIELGNRAEVILQERSREHNTELQSVKNRAEEYIGFQGQNITSRTNSRYGIFTTGVRLRGCCEFRSIGRSGRRHVCTGG